VKTRSDRIPFTQEFILERCVPEPNTGCWLWTGVFNDTGYGLACGEGKTRGAHRISFRVFKSEIPPGMHVLHRCDTPACVNPDHLFLGNHFTNMADAAKKLRLVHKLTPLEVRQIRSLYADGNHPIPRLAAYFRVTKSALHRIITGENWKHLDEGYVPTRTERRNLRRAARAADSILGVRR